MEDPDCISVHWANWLCFRFFFFSFYIYHWNQLLWFIGVFLFCVGSCCLWCIFITVIYIFSWKKFRIFHFKIFHFYLSLQNFIIAWFSITLSYNEFNCNYHSPNQHAKPCLFICKPQKAAVIYHMKPNKPHWNLTWCVN